MSTITIDLSPPTPTTPTSPLRALVPGRLARRRSTTCFGPYPPPDPNLELHSAAASGNVGLVHYALTHGQPVNSVLHGVLPLHAACSGGSVSVVRMLIERGADVNAPRLPRRYSDGKKSTAPSVGAAGSTPLHFAAANGHADIVQILLTCGAKANKADKNGMTPEALAEINGHTDVIRVLRVWEHLMANDAKDTASIAPSVSTVNGQEPPSPSGSTVDLASIKGKNRSASFVSQMSTSTSGSVVRLKQSIESIGLRRNGRHSRSGSFASSTRGAGAELSRLTPLAIDDGSQDPSPNEYSPSISSPQHSGFEGLDRSFSHSSGTSLTTPADMHSIYDGELSPSFSPGLGPTPSRNNPSITGSSRRPSLPSILEKPGAAFRAALRRDHNHRPPPIDTGSAVETSPTTSSPLSPEIVSPTQSTHHSLFRGRQRSSDDQSKHRHARKYMSKHTLTSLFKRGQSPPSRSPSPPDRSTPTQPIDPEQLQEGIERLQRASFEAERSMYGSAEDLSQPEPRILPPGPQSAPATKTSFFQEDVGSQPDQPDSAPLPSSATLPQLSVRSEIPSTTSSNGERRRPRKTSEVIAPSPLAQEWATSSDSDTPPTIGIRRSKTEVYRSPSNPSYKDPVPRPALQAYRSQPPSPLRPATPKSRTSSASSSSPGVRSVSGQRFVADSSELRKAASIKRGSQTYIDEMYKDNLDSQDDAEDASAQEAEDAVDAGQEAQLEEDDEALDAEDEEFHDAAEDEIPTEVQAQPVQVEDAEEQDVDRTETTPNGSIREAEAGLASLGLGHPVGESTHHDSTLAVDSDLDAGARTPVEHDYISHQHGRHRGASIGSNTTESSRISTTPSLRMSLITTDSELRTPTSGQFDSTYFAPALNLSHVHSRPRGKSVSSISSQQSDLAFSYNMAPSPTTSLTPPSTISLNHGRFPPVPEHEVAPVPHRRVSNRAEAMEMKKQAEQGIMQLAQLPATLDSSRDLAAQLAAYGDGHALEKEFAERERLLRGSGESETSDARSDDDYFSAMSDTHSKFSGTDESDLSHAGPSRRRVSTPSNLRHAILPMPSAKSGKARKSIDSIYAKREAAYRERMAALTALPPVFPSSVASRSGNALSSSSRSRIASGESWLTAGQQHQQHRQHSHHQRHEVEAEVDRHPDISGPLPVHSSIEGIQSRHPSSGKRSVRSVTGPSSIRHGHPSSSAHKPGYIQPSGDGSGHTPSIASRPPASTRTVSSSRLARPPAPIADVVKARYAGMAPPSHVPQPPRLDSASPYISVFSHRYAGQPHDGDDSDDESHPDQRLTVIENDWRGGRVVGTGDDFKKGRWGQLKGAIGHLGRK